MNFQIFANNITVVSLYDLNQASTNNAANITLTKLLPVAVQNFEIYLRRR